MATTRFWKIEGTGKNLSNVINYVINPEKVEILNNACIFKNIVVI